MELEQRSPLCDQTNKQLNITNIMTSLVQEDSIKEKGPNEDMLLQLNKMKEELARKDKLLGTLEDRLSKKEQAMTK